MTNQFGMESEGGKIFSLPTTSGLKTLVKPSCMPMGLSTEVLDPPKRGRTPREVTLSREEERKKSAKYLTVQMAVSSLKKNVITNIPVKDVEREDMGKQTAPQKAIREGTYRMMPKYL